jgi:hypothetical protein
LLLCFIIVHVYSNCNWGYISTLQFCNFMLLYPHCQHSNVFLYIYISYLVSSRTFSSQMTFTLFTSTDLCLFKHFIIISYINVCRNQSVRMVVWPHCHIPLYVYCICFMLLCIYAKVSLFTCILSCTCQKMT